MRVDSQSTSVLIQDTCFYGGLPYFQYEFDGLGFHVQLQSLDALGLLEITKQELQEPKVNIYGFMMPIACIGLFFSNLTILP